MPGDEEADAFANGDMGVATAHGWLRAFSIRPMERSLRSKEGRAGNTYWWLRTVHRSEVGHVVFGQPPYLKHPLCISERQT
jgi:hypothetical protein